MKVEKQTSEYTIFKRNDGRYAVKGGDKQYVNGEEKAKILLGEGLIKTAAPNPNKATAEAAPADAGATEEAAAQGGAE